MSRVLWLVENVDRVLLGLAAWVVAALVIALIAGPIPRLADREEGHSG